MPNDPISGVSQFAGRGTTVSAPQGTPVDSTPVATPPGSAAPVPAVAAQASQPDPHAVQKAAESINEFIKSTSRNLQFSVDKETGIVVVKVVDQETGDVIRQIPGEETLAIAKNLDSVQGVLFRSKA